MARAVLWMKELSGSRCSPSGVGTQMTMASQEERPSKSVVAESLPSATALATRSAPMCLMYDSPRRMASVFLGSTSKPVTVKPASAKTSPSGRPTYPWPITPTRADRDWMRLRRVLSIART